MFHTGCAERSPSEKFILPSSGLPNATVNSGRRGRLAARCQLMVRMSTISHFAYVDVFERPLLGLFAFKGVADF